jgi:hypothetical protein
MMQRTQNQNNNSNNNNNDDVVDVDAGSNHVINANNNNVERAAAQQPPVVLMDANTSNNNNNNSNNANNNNFLQVRVPPPTQSMTSNTSLLRPFHIHRRKNYFARASSTGNGTAAAAQTTTHNQPTASSLVKRRGLSSNSNTNNSNNNKRTNTKHQQQQQAPPSYTDGEIVRILIPTNGFASERQLAECLSQAGETTTINDEDHNSFTTTTATTLNDDESWDSMDEYYDYMQQRDYSSNRNPHQRGVVAGMFRESDRVFIPLSVIYSNPLKFVGEVLSLKRPPPPVTQHRPAAASHSPERSAVMPPSSTQRSIFIQFLEMFGILIVVLASWWSYSAARAVDWDHFLDVMVTKFEVFVWGIISTPFWLFDVLVEFPLRELYRYGPSVVGWEGEALPRICAQVTYTGDEGFWSRNIEECERIYRAKEDAAMQVRKPLFVLFIIVIVWYMVKSIVEARALRRRERIDPNMVETFRAINMLSRQLRRAMNTR